MWNWRAQASHNKQNLVIRYRVLHCHCTLLHKQIHNSIFHQWKLIPFVWTRIYQPHNCGCIWMAVRYRVNWLNHKRGDFINSVNNAIASCCTNSAHTFRVCNEWAKVNIYRLFAVSGVIHKNRAHILMFIHTISFLVSLWFPCHILFFRCSVSINEMANKLNKQTNARTHTHTSFMSANKNLLWNKEKLVCHIFMLSFVAEHVWWVHNGFDTFFRYCRVYIAQA